MRILVVDDDPDIRRICRVNLRFLGHTVIEAGDGDEALWRAASDRPDLIVLDLMMEGKDGLFVLATLKERPEARDIPVVLLSAKAMVQDQLQGLEAGADEYVTKPFAPYDLARVIDRIMEMSLEEREQHRERNLELLGHVARGKEKPSLAS